MPVSRREWLGGLAAGALAGMGRTAAAEGPPAAAPSGSLALQDFQPTSMLHVAETRVLRARFPAIDTHTHLSDTTKGEKGVPVGEEMTFLIAVPPIQLSSACLRAIG